MKYSKAYCIDEGIKFTLTVGCTLFSLTNTKTAEPAKREEDTIYIYNETRRNIMSLADKYKEELKSQGINVEINSGFIVGKRQGKRKV